MNKPKFNSIIQTVYYFNNLIHVTAADHALHLKRRLAQKGLQ